MKNPKNFYSAAQKIEKRFKSSIKDTTYDVGGMACQGFDYMYNQSYPSKYDQIDKFQEGMESVLNFTDNFTKVPYGYISSFNGRAVRGNYQNIYARNPLPDKFDRAFDSYKKATEYDY